MSSSAQLFIAGLGNLPYPRTRHSLGHLVLDSIASRVGIRLQNSRNGYLGQGKFRLGHKDTLVNLTLFKSKSFMNISGPSIVQAYRETALTPSSMVILSDSVSHRICTLSVKRGGSHNGHNGLKSIIAALGGELGFYRFRLGIGRDESDLEDYVMYKLSSFELRYWDGEGLDAVMEQLGIIANLNAGHK